MPSMPCPTPPLILFVTHHKCGTWWATQAFDAMRLECHVPFRAITSDSALRATGLCNDSVQGAISYGRMSRQIVDDPADKSCTSTVRAHGWRPSQLSRLHVPRAHDTGRCEAYAAAKRTCEPGPRDRNERGAGGGGVDYPNRREDDGRAHRHEPRAWVSQRGHAARHAVTSTSRSSSSITVLICSRSL